jgi:hypothetical protein
VNKCCFEYKRPDSQRPDGSGSLFEIPSFQLARVPNGEGVNPAREFGGMTTNDSAVFLCNGTNN